MKLDKAPAQVFPNQETALEAHAAPHHIVPVQVYVNVLIVLTILTITTVAAAYHNFGAQWLNVFIAITIATVKATLVVLFFMHVKYAGKLIHTLIISGIAWLLLLIIGILTDFLTRGNMVTLAAAMPLGG